MAAPAAGIASSPNKVSSLEARSAAPSYDTRAPKVTFPGVRVVLIPARGPSRVAIGCPQGSTPCSGTVTLRQSNASGKHTVPLASRTFTLRGGGTVSLALNVSAAGVALARTSGPFKADVIVTTTFNGANRTTTHPVTVDAVPLAPNPIKVTFVGDSVPAAINYTTSAKQSLSNRFRMHFDLQVCRRLAGPSCFGRTAAPPSAVSTIEGRGAQLGDVLVVMVGYNDDTHGYGASIDRVMHDALRQGARGVVWATLRERHPNYRGTNAAIRDASHRWKRLVVADWNAHSVGSTWFANDGLHLNGRGADALAAFLPTFIVQAAELPPPGPAASERDPHEPFGP